MATNSFVLNLAGNESGEFVLKGSAELITPEDPTAEKRFLITLEIPNETFDYAADLLGTDASKLSVEYSALTDMNRAELVFAGSGGGSPK